MTKHRFLPHLSEDELKQKQLAGLQWTVNHALNNSPHYRKVLGEAGVAAGDIKSLDDLTRLPFTTVADLRDGYPLPLLSVPEEDVVRIHASSGTTGKRKVMCYTQNDIDTWKHMFARCYETAGLTTRDRVQVCVGYGLWTAGVGFQLGCEHFGALALPIGPGNMDMQMQLAVDMEATCLGSTASMALLMGEEVEKAGLQDEIKLKKCIFGAEAHSPAMRAAFEEKLGLEDSYDISGLTELYGPGAGLECTAHEGIHYWGDIYILEILDPTTLQPVKPGEIGEMVVTTLRKEASPLIRYRTRDLTRILPDPCPCGITMPRHDHIHGRSDDMIIFRGVNVYPGQIAAALEPFADVSSEYQIHLSRSEGRDFMTVRVERHADADATNDENLAQAVGHGLHKALMARAAIQIVNPGELPRSFGKSKRVIDDRDAE